MLEEAIELVVTDSDLTFDHLRSSISKVLNGDLSQRAKNHYHLAKKIREKQLEHYGSTFTNIQEQLQYDMLEMCMFFRDCNITYCNAEQLSNVLYIDPVLKRYVEHHVLHNGIWAKLKYKIPITTKTDVMIDALGHL